ncbi:MAG: hypothetical protein ACJ72L_13445 [Marmoricola sp.]
MIPSSLVPEGLVQRLQQLPGFDNPAVTEAMRSVSENVFVLRRRPG